MQWLIDFVTNPFIIAGISSWLLAQIAKFIIYAIVNKTFDLSRLHGDGGMPSGHSATVMSLATMCGFRAGFDSALFAVAMILAIIVMHDALGVRREAGKQAVVLNTLIELLSTPITSELHEVKLKEFVGHTPVQVFAGGFVGLVNSLVLHFFIFK
jgi:acid phosphatase family membrane protein YuiD